jgi:hypothetical protein
MCQQGATGTLLWWLEHTASEHGGESIKNCLFREPNLGRLDWTETFCVCRWRGSFVVPEDRDKWLLNASAGFYRYLELPCNLEERDGNLATAGHLDANPTGTFQNTSLRHPTCSEDVRYRPTFAFRLLKTLHQLNRLHTSKQHSDYVCWVKKDAHGSSSLPCQDNQSSVNTQQWGTSWRNPNRVDDICRDSNLEYSNSDTKQNAHYTKEKEEPEGEGYAITVIHLIRSDGNDTNWRDCLFTWCACLNFFRWCIWGVQLV